MTAPAGVVVLVLVAGAGDLREPGALCVCVFALGGWHICVWRLSFPERVGVDCGLIGAERRE